MFYDPRTGTHGLPHNPWTALVTPRPIGWVSSRSATDLPNLAPYSFFNAAATHPPFVMLSSTPRKDSLTNIETTGVFAINIVGAELAEAMSRSSAPVPPEVNEFSIAGVTERPCRSIDAPCVAESTVVIECILNRVISLAPKSGLPCDTHIVLGEVTGIEIADHVMRDGRVRTDLIRPVSRLGYLDYAVTEQTFEIPRPGS
ncbi:flavin reductase family protein [Mangrovicoccus algicola]|uniref:Flavin reductase family protein n=1 Tax=Mangrovicoccus algicola TaxID=2771008 RepID=A0A8J6YVU7_9RHOB|nr:flavin reductase family protein [Mangrovicoccus algicola]MBE3638800.1 flavin reductase family protein [Mangrovicoccus algicola]